jgi:hypothetical protein
MCHEAMYLMVQLSLKTYWFYKAFLASALHFVIEIFAPQTWDNNVMGLHGSYCRLVA